MRSIFGSGILLVVIWCLPAVGGAGDETPHDGRRMLQAVIIRLPSSRELSRLRRMPLEIVRVRPDPDRGPDAQSLSGGLIVEAIVTPEILAKLKRDGYQVSESLPSSR